MTRYPILKRDEKHSTPGIAPDDKGKADMLIMLCGILCVGFIVLAIWRLAT